MEASMEASIQTIMEARIQANIGANMEAGVEGSIGLSICTSAYGEDACLGPRMIHLEEKTDDASDLCCTLLTRK
jgi:hypothetical protein